MPYRKKNLFLRATALQSIRNFFSLRGFLEVETPLRIPANAPEEFIDPLPSESMYLQTSPEICMKRLLCRGYERIFQLSHCWRSGERGRRHVPEFTMLEWYRSNSDYLDLMQDCQDLLKWVSEACGVWNGIMYQGQSVDLCAPADRITVSQAFLHYGGIDMQAAVADGSFDEIMVTRIEPALAGNVPVILMDYPAEMAALARIKPEDARVAERFELYVAGLELANGFSELNDPREQLSRFVETNRKRQQAGSPALPLPSPFLEELSGMPPSAGIALGVDRLVMLLADAERIDDVVAFTPEEL